jgi:uncharacterized protein
MRRARAPHPDPLPAALNLRRGEGRVSSPHARRRTVISFLCALLVSTSLFALDVPPPPDHRFTDRAGLVSPTEGDLLNRKLSDFEQQSGAQFIIYIFASLEGESIEDFTIRCAEKWKAGQKKYDNGLILFVFAKDRAVRIEVGYGLEGTITDAFSSRVIREVLAPPFQQQQYATGLSAAADAIIKKIRTGEEPVAPLERRGSRQGAQGESIGIFGVLFILFIVFFVILPMLRRGGGGCGGCVLPILFSGGGGTFTGGGFSSGGGGFSGGGFGGGGFSGGGGGFGGGGATGGW